ncbi:D-beta-hydroxybutyrate dehydrogenase, mitochondrial-like [Amphiura filiformis]|uniref:D-beta-hydroxybutyrate dehydrogenase, mitochondrial-like n=1 Tax=Amphiura filiformis TaxID=82378 RepID=UPI003B214E14
MAVGPVTYFTCSFLLFLLAYLVILVEQSIGSYFIALCIACGGVYVAAKLIPRGRETPQGRAVFITGCDTGFGHELACRLDKLGFKVFAGCLVPNGAGARQLLSKSINNLLVVPCDVTSNVSVNSAKDFLSQNLQEHELYAVVNNAGIWRWSEIEWASAEMFQNVAEINIYGMIRVTKAFLPMIRRSKGRIVNIGSISGLWTIPTNAPYCMTKYAIECYTDALRYEMHKWNVKVVLVEPGHYGKCTAIVKHLDGYPDQLWQAMDETCRNDYGRDYLDAWQQYYKEAMIACYPDPSPVVDAMVDAVTSRNPKHRYLVGALWTTYFEAYWNMMLPSWLTDRQQIRIADSVAIPAALTKSKSS